MDSGLTREELKKMFNEWIKRCKVEEAEKEKKRLEFRRKIISQWQKKIKPISR